MGIADQMGWQNPFTQFVGNNRNTLMGFGAGLASGPTFGKGVAAGLQGAQQGKMTDTLFAQQKEEKAKATEQTNATRSWLEQQGFTDLVPLVDAGQADIAYSEALKRMQPGYGQQAPTDLSSTTSGRAQLAQQYGLSGDAAQEYVLTGKLPGGNQTTRAGVGQPIYGRNKETGAVEPWQSMTDGTMVNIANPGADPSRYDFNPGIAAGERAAGGGDAKTAVAARAALPAAESAYAMTQQAIATIMGNKTGVEQNFGNVMGIPTQKLPAYPGSSLADLRNQVDQLSGTAFLQIRQALKGAGQVTDYEGQKGEIALNRMRAAAESGSKADFDAALIDYQTAIDHGLQLLREAAQGGYSQGAPAISGGNSGDGWEVVGVQ